jgi:small subunit ribosomal protein S19
MVRSLKKGPFISSSLLDAVKRMNKDGKKQVITTWSRASTIIPAIIGHTFTIHRGNEHIPVFIVDQIVGYKLGEFATTRNKARKSSKKNKRLFLWDKKFIRLEYDWAILNVRIRFGTRQNNIILILSKKIGVFENVFFESVLR